MWPFSKKRKYQPPRYRIVTTKKAPYKFYVEVWRKGYTPELNLEYDINLFYDCIFVDYEKHVKQNEGTNWFPVTETVGIRKHFLRYGDASFDHRKTRLFDDDVDAALYIRELIKKDEEAYQVKLEAERKAHEAVFKAKKAEEKLQEFINQHPPRNYP